MRRLPGRRPLVYVPVVMGVALTLTGCDEGAGTPSVPTSASPPGPTPSVTTGLTSDDSIRTTASADGDRPRTPPELRAGAVLTNDDSAAVVRLSPGEEVTLRLAPPLQDSTPTVSDPRVVELVPVQRFADPGYDEYAMLALSAGETRVLVQAQGADGPGLLVVVLVQGR